MMSSILPKNERKNKKTVLWYLRSIFFKIIFWENQGHQYGLQYVAYLQNLKNNDQLFATYYFTNSNLEKADIVDVVLFHGNLHVNPTVKKKMG
jgi:hypothetical protein